MSEVAQKELAMKKTVLLCLFILAGVCLQAQTLEWDLMFLKMGGSSGAAETPQISRTIRMKAGDLFEITITPASECFCYVVMYNAAKEIVVLSNRHLEGSEVINTGLLPIERRQGTKTLYVIMSREKQTEIENLIQIFNKDPSLPNKDNLHNEVVRLQKITSDLGEPPSIIIPGGVTERGNSDFTRFSERETYVRIIAISH
jgi:hypothetical protein